MKRALKTTCLLASVGIAILASGCVSSGGILRDWMSGQQKALARAKDDGVPAAELDKLIEEAKEWIANTAPSISGVQESSYQKVFVVGGTINRSNAKSQEGGRPSVDDEEVASRTEDLFFELRESEAMQYNFAFFDRTSDFNVDLSQLTGDVQKFGDPLGRGNNTALPDTYHPDDIYLLKLSFNEKQDLRENNSTITFTLRAIIEWGGSPGQPVTSKSFDSKLVFDNGLGGLGGKGWIPAE